MKLDSFSCYSNQYLLFHNRKVFEEYIDNSKKLGSGHLSFKEVNHRLSKSLEKILPGKELFLWKSGLSGGGDRRQDQISMGKKRAVHTGILPESIHKPSSFLHLISTSTAYWDNEKRIEGVSNPIKKPILVLNASPPLEFTGYPFFLSMGLHPELWKNEKGIKENKKSNKRKKYKWKILIFLCSNFLIRIESFLQDLAKLLMQNDQLKKRVDTTIRLLNQLTTIKAAQVRLTISIILLLLINNHSGIKGTELWMNPLKEFTPNKFLYDFCRNMIHRDALNRRRGNREIFSFMYDKEVFLFLRKSPALPLGHAAKKSDLKSRKEQVFIHIFLLITKTFFSFILNLILLTFLESFSKNRFLLFWI
ncbi:hypothetical protein ACJX0J_001754, partial [Zea mays]